MFKLRGSERWMTEINEMDEFDRDWDWFAVDTDGSIGHFTSAGQQALPKSVKRDRESALRLMEYFLKEAPKSVSYTVHPEAEKRSGGWRNEFERNRYLNSFVNMAATGLFSHDTEMYGRDTGYFLIGVPQHPLLIHELPPEIRDLLTRTQSTCSFGQSPYIPAEDTCNW